VTRASAYGGTACPATDGQTSSQSCNTQNCPIDCVGNWTPWGTCSKTCGGGTQTRTFKVTTQAQYGGIACPVADGTPESQPCNTQNCPVNCIGEWGNYGACNKLCGGGTQSRQYKVIQLEAYGGQACPYYDKYIQTQSCNTEPCKVIYVSSNKTNYNLYNEYVATYGAPATTTIITLVINGGVIVGGLDIGQFPNGSEITIENNGSIQGAGGAGGAGGTVYGAAAGAAGGATNGGNGGNAIKANYVNQKVIIKNMVTGSIYAGGGGGGGGGCGQSIGVEIFGDGGSYYDGRYLGYTYYRYYAGSWQLYNYGTGTYNLGGSVVPTYYNLSTGLGSYFSGTWSLGTLRSDTGNGQYYGCVIKASVGKPGGTGATGRGSNNSSLIGGAPSTANNYIGNQNGGNGGNGGDWAQSGSAGGGNNPGAGGNPGYAIVKGTADVTINNFAVDTNIRGAIV
jgi:hypothetical protein